MEDFRTWVSLVALVLAWEPAAAQGGETGPADWRASLLVAREAIWRDYFSDPDKLARGLTPDFLALNEGGPPWQSREAVVAAARRAVAAGASLKHLMFPKTEIQRYGDVAIIYTTYEMQLSARGQDGPIEKGQATEVFWWNGGFWLHTGWQLGVLPR